MNPRHNARILKDAQLGAYNLALICTYLVKEFHFFLFSVQYYPLNNLTIYIRIKNGSIAPLL